MRHPPTCLHGHRDNLIGERLRQCPSSALALANSASVNSPCTASQSATTPCRPRVTSRRRAASASHADVCCSSTAAMPRAADAGSDSREMVKRSRATAIPAVSIWTPRILATQRRCCETRCRKAATCTRTLTTCGGTSASSALAANDANAQELPAHERPPQPAAPVVLETLRTVCNRRRSARSDVSVVGGHRSATAGRGPPPHRFRHRVVSAFHETAQRSVAHPR